MLCNRVTPQQFQYTVSHPALLQGMGCGYCRPTTAVTEDPNSSIYASMGTCVMIHPEGDYTMLSGFFDGLLYVRDGTLYYATVAGKIFWCECVGSDWEVSDIKRVEVVTGNVTIRGGPRSHPRHLTMNPGLKIRFRDHNTLMMAMPDAVSFCAQLREYMSSAQSAGKSSGEGNEDQEMVSPTSTTFMASLDMYTPATANFVTLTPTNESATYSTEAQETL